jgi:hypothetical protein
VAETVHRQPHWFFTLAVSALVALLITWLGLNDWRFPFAIQPGAAAASPKTSAACPQLFDQARLILDKEATAAAPGDPGANFTPSISLPGRMTLSVAWMNPVPLQEGVVAIAGRYGAQVASDYYIDHTQPSASPGECWNWYSYIPKDDSEPLKVQTSIDGLWPNERYCFYTAFKTSAGAWSRPSEIKCLTSTWNSSWGTPAYPSGN